MVNFPSSTMFEVSSRAQSMTSKSFVSSVNFQRCPWNDLLYVKNKTFVTSFFVQKADINTYNSPSFTIKCSSDISPLFSAHLMKSVAFVSKPEEANSFLIISRYGLVCSLRFLITFRQQINVLFIDPLLKPSFLQWSLYFSNSASLKFPIESPKTTMFEQISPRHVSRDENLLLEPGKSSIFSQIPITLRRFIDPDTKLLL